MLQDQERVKANSRMGPCVALLGALILPVVSLEPRDTVTFRGRDECELLFAVSDDMRARDIPAHWNGRFGSDKARSRETV